MKILRRLIGVLVMIAGVLGLALSLAGLIGIWSLKPTLVAAATTTITTLGSSVTTSQTAMEITEEALGATVESVNALSEMLATTAASVEDTQPVFEQVNGLMGETLPNTFTATTDSLTAAQEAATVLESSMKSLEVFTAILSSTPMIGAMMPEPPPPYSPEKPLATSLGELATTLEAMPATFTGMSENLDKADDNLEGIKTNLTTMSQSVKVISGSLTEYQGMIGQSHASMENLKGMLTSLQTNLNTILNGAALGLSLFFLWLLAAQVVILSQGWELYQGTAGRMEGGPAEPVSTEPAPAA